PSPTARTCSGLTPIEAAYAATPFHLVTAGGATTRPHPSNRSSGNSVVSAPVLAIVEATGDRSARSRPRTEKPYTPPADTTSSRLPVRAIGRRYSTWAGHDAGSGGSTTSMSASSTYAHGSIP